MPPQPVPPAELDADAVTRTVAAYRTRFEELLRHYLPSDEAPPHRLPAASMNDLLGRLSDLLGAGVTATELDELSTIHRGMVERFAAARGAVPATI